MPSHIPNSKEEHSGSCPLRQVAIGCFVVAFVAMVMHRLDFTTPVTSQIADDCQCLSGKNTRARAIASWALDPVMVQRSSITVSPPRFISVTSLNCYAPLHAATSFHHVRDRLKPDFKILRYVEVAAAFSSLMTLVIAAMDREGCSAARLVPVFAASVAVAHVCNPSDGAHRQSAPQNTYTDAPCRSKASHTTNKSHGSSGQVYRAMVNSERKFVAPPVVPARRSRTRSYMRAATTSPGRASPGATPQGAAPLAVSAVTLNKSGTRGATQRVGSALAPPFNKETDRNSKTGVLLLNLGGPETLDDVQPFLENLFSDGDIIRLPPFLRGFQGTLGSIIASARAAKSCEGYASIGGGSPIRRITEQQARAVKSELSRRGSNVEVYVGMRYWHPFCEDTLERIKADGVTDLVILPLYPQYSISTSGSSLRQLSRAFRQDPEMASLRHVVVKGFCRRAGYIDAMANLIAKELEGVDAETKILFSAHGVPRSYVDVAGDPYEDDVRDGVELIMDELRKRGFRNDHVLAYQSKVGPVEWLGPYTDDAIRQLGREGCKGLVVVPVSFVSEHIETLQEIDIEYRELAETYGIESWRRVAALGLDPAFISTVADVVLEARRCIEKYGVKGVNVPPSINAARNNKDQLDATCDEESDVLEVSCLWNLDEAGRLDDVGGRQQPPFTTSRLIINQM